MTHDGHMNHMNHMDHTGHVGHVMDASNASNTAKTMDHMMKMSGMKMYFHGGCDEVILFDFWRIDVVWELLVSMLIIFVMAFLYEGLKYSREYLFRRALSSSQYSSTSRNNITITDGRQPVRYMEQIIMPPAVGMLSVPHLIQTLLHMVQFLVSYFLMLIFMTYNVWLCLACLLGAGAGYFFFGWRKAVVVDITEHCH